MIRFNYVRDSAPHPDFPHMNAGSFLEEAIVDYDWQIPLIIAEWNRLGERTGHVYRLVEGTFDVPLEVEKTGTLIPMPVKCNEQWITIGRLIGYEK